MEKIIVKCPLCKRMVGEHDARATIPTSRRCKKCNVLVVYKPETKETITRDIPQRQTASGMRY